jgi:hypothetical protein
MAFWARGGGPDEHAEGQCAAMNAGARGADWRPYLAQKHEDRIGLPRPVKALASMPVDSGDSPLSVNGYFQVSLY